MTKQNFYKHFDRVPERILRFRINEIIYSFRKNFPENKNKTRKDIINTHYIELSELQEYFDSYVNIKNR